MAQIPDFSSETFDDPKELRRQLSRVLNELNRDANGSIDPSIGRNQIFPWIDDGKTPIPRGYAVADGTKGTFDVKNSKTIYLQKVSG